MAKLKKKPPEKKERSKTEKKRNGVPKVVQETEEEKPIRRGNQ